MSKPKRTLTVIDLATREAVHVIDCHEKSDAAVDKVETGLLMRMDLDKYGVVDSKHDE